MLRVSYDSATRMVLDFRQTGIGRDRTYTVVVDDDNAFFEVPFDSVVFHCDTEPNTNLGANVRGRYGFTYAANEPDLPPDVFAWFDQVLGRQNMLWFTRE